MQDGDLCDLRHLRLGEVEARGHSGGELYDGLRMFAGVEVAGLQGRDEGFPLPQPDRVAVHVAGFVQPAVHDGWQFDGLRLAGLVVGLLLGDLRQRADEERPRRAGPGLVVEADPVGAGSGGRAASASFWAEGICSPSLRFACSRASSKRCFPMGFSK